MSQTLTQLRNHPSLVATEEYVQHHVLVFAGYTLALIIVSVFVIAPLVTKLTRSGFGDNLLYTGPGGALKADLGSCMSHRDTNCGAAEPFSNKNATGPSWKTERSRFVNGREPDAVMNLDQEGADAMTQEINSIQGADDGDGSHMQANSKVSSDNVSTFASRKGVEAQLESLLRQ